MKKLALFGMVVFLITSTVPSYGFLDYFFSGSASRDAIDNSAVGDLRAWWTGNPGYQFNPYWSGPQPNQQGQQANPSNPASTQGYSPMGAPSAGTSQAPPPTVKYYPQQAPQGAYGPSPGQPAQSMDGGVTSTVSAGPSTVPGESPAVSAGPSTVSACPSAISGAVSLSRRTSGLSGRSPAAASSSPGLSGWTTAVSRRPSTSLSRRGSAVSGRPLDLLTCEVGFQGLCLLRRIYVGAGLKPAPTLVS